ncbi:acyl-CoA thioesterase/bile acid-CoA:amino acid N-acyltransferase family protein [Pseudonocardia xinjiangensis]|uniref:acyl-CoA thioesterase/bile acid-CoA:amino acid N-acyltransferase family protein n=1 Tax=Pseudonocardia xinjiangensis TaxID=75289 RepID=UPI003D930B7A
MRITPGAIAGALVAALVAAGCSAGTVGQEPRRVIIATSAADVLVDERVAITVHGLGAGDDVTLWARRVDDLGRPWLAHGTFTAGTDGTVAVATQAPRAGTYSGVDAMGLFSSMQVADGAATHPPFPVTAAPAAPVALTALVDGEPVASTQVVQRFAAPGVVTHPVREEGLVGELHVPPGPGPHPGVVLLGGSEGGVTESAVADLLAARGFATLALGYFGADGLPGELVRIPLEYFEQAFTWLRARPEVADGRVGVIGTSRGGELALWLGATFPQVGAVVSYVGSGLGYGGLPAAGFTGGPLPAAWTYRGKDLPFVMPTYGPAASARYLGTIVLGAPVTDIAGTWPDIQAAGPEAVAAATIPVERIDGPVLLLSGEDDRLWPSAPMSDVAFRRLADGGHPHRHEHHAYPGAGHYFGGAPFTGPFPTVLLWPIGFMTGGGTREANARATADSWPRVLSTLREGLESR